MELSKSCDLFSYSGLFGLGWYAEGLMVTNIEAFIFNGGAKHVLYVYEMELFCFIF